MDGGARRTKRSLETPRDGESQVGRPCAGCAMKDDRLAHASHELKTPLSAMLMWVHLLRAGRAKDRSAALDAIEQSARAQMRVIDDLFDAVRGPGGKPAVDQSAFELATRPVVMRLPPRRPTRKAASKLLGLQVLVVEDDDLARDGLALVLEGYGARVATAASVAEALDDLDRAWPDVLISDIAMPREDGYALIRKVRALELERGTPLPAAALTARALPEDEARVLGAGFRALLPKPVEPADLLAAVLGLSGRAPRDGGAT